MAYQKYRMKIVLLTHKEDTLEVQFEYLAGIYVLHKNRENYVHFINLFMEARIKSKVVEICVLGNNIIEASM